MAEFIVKYISNKDIWDTCSLSVAEWFSKIKHDIKQKNYIVWILYEKISMIESGRQVNAIGLQETMGIYERDLYLEIIFEIKKHIRFIRYYGYSLKTSIKLAIYSMCYYYYRQNHYISSVIFDALGFDESIQNNTINNDLIQNNL